MSIIEKKMIVHNKIEKESWNRSSIVELTVFKEFWSTNKFEGNSQPSDQKLWLAKKKNRPRKFECAQRTLKLVLLKVGVLNIITNKRLQD
jgi:hypothetical protein